MFLANEVADRSVASLAVGDDTGRAGVQAQFVLHGQALVVVALPQDAVVADQILGDDEAGDAAGTRRAVRSAGQHQLDDVLGEFVLAVGNKDLRAEESVGAVALGDRSGGQGTHIGPGLRFGEVHRPRPFG